MGELWEIILRRRQARRYEGENGETVLSPLVFFRQKGRGVPKAGVPVTEFRKPASRLKNQTLFSMTFAGRRSEHGASRRRPEGRDADLRPKTESIFERYNITDDRDLEVAVRKTHEYVSQLPKDRGNSFDDKIEN
jgi:hypothetical protein